MKRKSVLLCIALLLAGLSCNKDMVQDGVDSSQDPRVPDINVKLVAESIPSGGSTSDITGVHAGSSKDVVFTIENRGTEDLVLTEYPIVAVSGDNADEFPQDQITPPVTILAGGTSEPFTVVFAPVDANAKSALITIESNDPDEPVYKFTINGRPIPSAKFYTRYRRGLSPLTVRFTDQSEGQVISREWDFNYDGIADSTETNPTYCYITPGTYTVSLKVTGPHDADYIVRTDYVTVMQPEKNIIDNTINWPVQIYAFDLDNDGDQDILARTDGRIRWWSNNGHGQFTSEGLIDNDFQVVSLYASDLDNNNDLDITGIDEDGILSWWRNNGSGNFGSRVNIDITGFPSTRNMYCADIDNDGDNDILGTAGYNISDIVVWKNNGNGTFAARIAIDGNFPGAYDVKTADIENDGDIDIVGAADGWHSSLPHIPGKISWWKNNGSGSFGTINSIDDSFDGARSIALADIDKDGYKDVVGAAYYINEVAWWKNNNGGTTWTKYTIETGFEGVYSIFADDFDLDGDIDIAGAASDGYDIVWWENNGSGIFSKHVLSNEFDRPYYIYASNLDDESDIEIISASSEDDEIAYWKIDQDYWYEHIVKSDFNGACSVKAADFDNDGDVDIVGTAYWDNDITWWENMNVVGTVWTERPIDTDFGYARSVFATNIDHDNDFDILGAARGDNDIVLWKNINNGSFEEHLITGNFTGAYKVIAADLTNDNSIDIIGAAWNGHKISWWKNENTSFGNEQIIISDSNTWSLTDTADLDNNGTVDILGSATTFGNHGFICWWRNTDGYGAFTLAANIVTESNVNDMVIADIDKDENIDVLFAGSIDPDEDDIYTSGIFICKNAGSGLFNDPVMLIEGYSSCVHIFDLDNDGDTDVIAGGSKLIWLENTDETGTIWLPHIIADTPNEVDALNTADIDGDGDMDILGALSNDNAIIWWENNLKN